MELVEFTQTDGKKIYINPNLVAIIQEGNKKSTYMWIAGIGVSLKDSVDKVKETLKESKNK